MLVLKQSTEFGKKNKNKNKKRVPIPVAQGHADYHLMLLGFSLFFMYEKGMRQDHTESQSWGWGSVRY